jgi:hypothetical protein
MSTNLGQEQALAHIRLVASFPGCWELRALRRVGGNRMTARGSFFLLVTATSEGLIYDRLDEALDWTEQQDESGAEVFIGMNPRTGQARHKEAVPAVTACFVDLDLPEGYSTDTAIAGLTSGEGSLPSFMVHSGYGLHVIYLLDHPSEDKATWRKAQRALVGRFAALGADRRVATDESRVLRLVPYANRKRWPSGVPTAIVFESHHRYSLTDLAGELSQSTSAPDRFLALDGHASDDEQPVLELDFHAVDDMQRLVETAEKTRSILGAWIQKNMQPGLHYGIIPVDGKEPTKPTLLKPGAELVALLFGWRFAFQADLESLQMYGPGLAGVFAYICFITDRHGRPVGQGRGVAELREPGMDNPNKTVKVALKRSQVDAVLRCAGLSQWFTQDLEEPRFQSPQSQALHAPPPTSPNGGGRRESQPDRCRPEQAAAIRTWLRRTRHCEDEILQFYGCDRLEELSATVADRVIRRLVALEDGTLRAGRGTDFPQ